MAKSPAIEQTELVPRPDHIVDIGLVKRVEQAIVVERTALALGSKNERPDGAVLDVGTRAAVFTEPEFFSTRAFALGLDGDVAHGDIDRVEDFYRERGMETQIEVSTLADRSLLSELASPDYRLIRFHNIYAMNPGDARPYETVVDVSEVDDALVSTWSEVLIEGFGYTDEVTRDAVTRWNRGLRETSGLHAMVGGLGSRIAGSASVFISDSVAVLRGAATLPDWRRRGVQSALISARLALALNSGCDLAVMTADPGSTSGRNAERTGFVLGCTQAVLGRDR